MMGFSYAVLWDFKFLPPNGVEKIQIQGTNIFSLHWTEESARENAQRLREAGYEAWVEEL